MNFLDSILGDDGCAVDGSVSRNPVSQLLDTVLDTHIGLARSGSVQSSAAAVQFASPMEDLTAMTADQVVRMFSCLVCVLELSDFCKSHSLSLTHSLFLCPFRSCSFLEFSRLWVVLKYWFHAATNDDDAVSTTIFQSIHTTRTSACRDCGRSETKG